MTAPLFATGPATPEVQRSAVLSSDGVYRYRLDRWWGPESTWMGSTRLPFLMLNPSTADANVDDPTIRRCMGFARREGFDGITVVNCYPLRATDPAEIDRHPNPFGEHGVIAATRNLDVVMEVAETASCIVAAYGAHPRSAAVGEPIVDELRREGVTVLCLGTTKDGHPRHPLYVRGGQPLVPFGGAR
jgi:hypothetical protein